MIIGQIHLALLSTVDGDISDRFLLDVDGINAVVSSSNIEAQLEWASLYWLSKLEAAGFPLCVNYAHAFYTAKTIDGWVAYFTSVIVPILNLNTIVL